MNVYVIGTALYPPVRQEKGRRLEEMAYRTARAALDDAGVSRSQLDHLTIGACDELDGRPISSMLMAAPAGGFLVDEMKVSDSGAMALCLGAARIMTGEFHLGLVSSWCKPSKADVDSVMRLRAEPFYSRPLGIDLDTTDGLFAETVAESLGVSEEEASLRAANAMERARFNPRAVAHTPSTLEQIAASPYVATPLREGHRAPQSDGAVTLVLASEAFVEQNRQVKPMARITGVGWAIDSYQLGSKRLGGMTSLRNAWHMALKQAGAQSAADFDVVELECPTSWHEAAITRVLEVNDAATVSPSGGTFAQNPLTCTGLVNAVEALLQVSGRAGPVQRPRAKRAVAQSSHGFAQQGNVVVCFEAVETVR